MRGLLPGSRMKEQVMSTQPGVTTEQITSTLRLITHPNNVQMAQSLRYLQQFLTAKTITLEQDKKMAVHDVMLFKIFDRTMASIIAFDWLWKNPRHASNPSHAITCSIVMVFAVMHSVQEPSKGYQSINSGFYWLKTIHQGIRVTFIFLQCLGMHFTLQFLHTKNYLADAHIQINIILYE